MLSSREAALCSPGSAYSLRLPLPSFSKPSVLYPLGLFPFFVRVFPESFFYLGIISAGSLFCPRMVRNGPRNSAINRSHFAVPRTSSMPDRPLRGKKKKKGMSRRALSASFCRQAPAGLDEKAMSHWGAATARWLCELQCEGNGA